MKLFVGSIIGAVIIFICQFLSWGVLGTHYPAQQYTTKQNEILSYLSTQFDSSGGYLLPATPKGASQDEMKSLAEKSMGKPWAQIFYHKSLDSNMGLNMAKNFVTNFIMVLFFCWIISGYTSNSFAKTLLAALLVGLIIFLHASYTEHIWYETFDLQAHLADYIITWGLTGVWLGWWLNRRRRV
ncbi:MAG: hypothetical protein JO072_05145 [Parafilimonas sp.]|nr:hypothetical protein [Parafilimonas sp.]